MSEQIFITDVSPRDGLQNQPVHLSTQEKLELVRLLANAGVASIEAASFVSPHAVPQMADAAEVLAALPAAVPGLRASVLAPNRRGLERAIAAGAGEIAVVLSSTETMNRRNIGMGLAEATRVSADTLAAAKAAGLATRGYVAVAVECPFEGAVTPATAVRLAERLLAAGADEIVLADTIGAGAPRQVRELLKAAAHGVPPSCTAVHLHDTRGFGLANAWVALEAGVRRFDASAGGIGGCPFAPGAAGNLATEDLVLMAHQCGLHTGISMSGLAAAVAFAEDRLGRPLGGRSMGWHRRSAAPHRSPHHQETST